MTNNTQTKSLFDVPFDEEMERAVIGAVLINPSLLVVSTDILNPDDFYLTRHQYIWHALIQLEDRKEPIDRKTLRRQLEDQGHYKDIGGDVYISELINSTQSAMYGEAYAELVQRDAVRRNLIIAGDRIKDIARDKQLDIDSAVAESEYALSSVTAGTRVGISYKTMTELSSASIDELEERIRTGDEGLGVPLGYKKLDTLLSGLGKGQLIIGGGRPGMGKTAFAINIALNAAKLGVKVAHFTMEMGADEIHYRRISIETGMPMQKLKGGDFTDKELSRFVSAAGRLAELPIFTDDSSSLTPSQLRNKAMRIKHHHGLDLLIVDYMQLMHAPGYEGNRVQEISYISGFMKRLARELNIPIFSLAQLSRKLEERANKRPQLSDLRESGSLEQDADIVMFFYRDIVYNEATENPNQADIIVAKHRNGPTDTIPLYFNAPLMKFEDGSVHSIDLSNL